MMNNINRESPPMMNTINREESSYDEQHNQGGDP